MQRAVRFPIPASRHAGTYRCRDVRRRSTCPSQPSPSRLDLDMLRAHADRRRAIALRGLVADEVHARRADEAGDEHIRRPFIQLEGRAVLLDPAGIQHHDLVGHRHRLDLVVGDVDRRGAELGCSRVISSRMFTRSAASRLDSGSSNRNAFGSRTIARPIATRWRWPPESSRACGRDRVSGSRSRPLPRTLRSISALGRPAIFSRKRCCRARSCADTARRTGTPSPGRASPAARRRHSAPSIRMWP